MAETLTTADVIASMLTEPTGASILDSGGAYGRHWERNAGMTTEAWESTPSATVSKWGDVTVSTFHYMRDRLRFHADMDAAFREFADTDEWEREPWLPIMKAWVTGVHDSDRYSDLSEPRTWNTYNGEDYLSQVLQGVTFRHDGHTYAIVQTHNGCDVRGGYSSPRVFRVECDMSEYFPYDNDGAELGCASCEWGGTLRASEFITREGYADSLEFGKDDDGNAVCPKCQGALVVDAPYVS